MMFGTFYGFVHGDVKKLLAPMDGAGNFCGVGDFKDYPNLYFSNLFAVSDSPSHTLENIFQ
jgi:hypothetical protein